MQSLKTLIFVLSSPPFRRESGPFCFSKFPWRAGQRGKIKRTEEVITKIISEDTRRGTTGTSPSRRFSYLLSLPLTCLSGHWQGNNPVPPPHCVTPCPLISSQSSWRGTPYRTQNSTRKSYVRPQYLESWTLIVSRPLVNRSMD